MGIEDASEADIDSMMSLIQEASFQRVAIGTPCINKSGKIFTVLGVFEEKYMSGKFHEIPIFPNSMPENECMALAGLYFDPQNPERQDVMMERMIYSSPILDLDKDQTAEAARLSVFMNEEAMEQLIEIVLKEESSVSESKAKKALSLLQTFVVRGLFNMTSTLKGEYTSFLQDKGLMINFLKLILSESDQQSIHPDELLVSSLLLELRADYLREAVMLSDKLTFEDAASSGNKVFVFTSHDASQMYVMRSEAPTDMFHFKFEMQFGEGDGEYFEGSLVASDPVNNANNIFVVDSAKFVKPDNATLLILKYARIVITDNNVQFDDLMKQLKVEIQQDES